MNLNLNFNGKTKLKDWWKQIKTLFQQVQTDVNNETSARKSADTTLQQNIDKEATARGNADKTLQSNIDKEASMRSANDDALLSSINTEKTNRQEADATLQNNITSEANFRQISDKALQTSINNEKTARENADNAHKNAVVLDHPDGSVTKNKLSDELKDGLHIHPNKTELDSITGDVLNNSHAHTNKNLLDGLTQALVDQIPHWNKEVLDEIERRSVESWNAAASRTIDDLSGVFCHDFGNVIFNKQIDPDWAEPENQYNLDERGILQTGDIIRFNLSSIKSESGADEAETASLSINVGYYSNYLNLISGESFKVGHNYIAVIAQPLTWDEEQGGAGADGTAYIILDDWKTQGAGGSANITKNNDSPTGDIIPSHITIGSRKGYSERTLSVGENNWTFGENQVAFGSSGRSRGKNSGVLFGENCTAGDSSRGNNAAGGLSVSANGERSCAFGGYQNSVAWKSVNGAILGGQNNIVWGTNSAIIAGGNNIINEDGNNSFCSGEYLVANAYNFIVGRYNISPQNGNTAGGSLLTVGCGTNEANRSNAMRVDNDGNVYAKTTINATGADYAELWEWMDGNPEAQDRTGYFATMDGDKIRLSQDGDDMARVGIISGNPAIIGDNYADEWCGKYLRDIYGRYLRERVSYPEIKDEDGNVIQQAYEADELILNPDYNPDEAYIPREQRKEYDFLGTHGKLVVHDDGTCEANGFCKPTNGGIATAAESGYHVMERIDENHIRVYVK
jgi:hypothetical protein|nr:MAG TPA: peptidase [Caudoviricetes sp.]